MKRRSSVTNFSLENKQVISKLFSELKLVTDNLLFIYLQLLVHLIQQNTCLWVAHGNNEGVSLGQRELYNTADYDDKQNISV